MSNAECIANSSAGKTRLPPIQGKVTKAENFKLTRSTTFGYADHKHGEIGEVKDSESWFSQLSAEQPENVNHAENLAGALMLSGETIKPPFLWALENHLVRELDFLGVHEHTGRDAQLQNSRLQAHREVFQYLIEDFRSYRPILSAIKNEYEMMLRYQTDYIKQLEPLQQMLATVAQQSDVQIMKIRDEQNKEVEAVKNQNKRLQMVIDGIRNEQFALETQVHRLTQRLAEQYDKYRSEADARKQLISDINDLKTQQEELIRQQKEASMKDKSDDPVVIRQSLQKAREEEKECTAQINHITANYGDVIPKTDYMDLLEKQKNLQLQMDEKTAEFLALKSEHDELLDTHKQIVKLRDEFYQESERLKQASTPRPDWGRCARVVPGGADRWQVISADKSSDQLVSVLLSELAGTGSNTKSPDYFTGRGLSEEVPPHLRYEGDVKNHKISRRDTALLIKDIWRERDSAQTQGVEATSLSQFVLDYLKSKFTDNADMAHQWAYNLDNACQKYVNDDRITTFYSVLTGRLDEQLYFINLQYIVSLLRVLGRVREEFQQMAPPPPEQTDAVTVATDGDAEAGETAEARLPREEFRRALHEYFEGQLTDDELEALVTAAVHELSNSREAGSTAETGDIEFMKLFFEDDEGKFGPFVDELKKQLDNLRVQYIERISGLLPTIDTPEALITPTELETAVYNNDPELETSVIEGLLFGAYRVTDRAELESCPHQSRETLIEYLMTRYIKPMVKLS